MVRIILSQYYFIFLESYNKFKNIQKASLLQEAKCFNDPKINEMKCSDIIGKIIYLINQVQFI